MGRTLFGAERIDRVGPQPVSPDRAGRFRTGPVTGRSPTAGPLSIRLTGRLSAALLQQSGPTRR